MPTKTPFRFAFSKLSFRNFMKNMQSAEAKSAAPGFQSFVNFLLSHGVKEPAAIAIANKNDDHPRLLMRLYSIVKGATHEEIAELISKYLSLPQALDGEELEETMEKLEDYFLVTHASISFGKRNPAVRQFLLTVLDHAGKYCTPAQTDFLDDLVLQVGVTLDDLLKTKGASAGVMELFPEVLRDQISSAIPNATALLEHLLAEAEAARADRKRVREVPEAPDELLCDENIADLGRECCSTDSTHDTTASGEEASAEDESGFTTPKPRGMSDRERDRERKRLLCAPLKMPRGDQD
jgi:hypothetical protein